ncbi:MAG TPA: MBL fold metallo-hydrolase [bacterium]|nr:MBL fold metallo-hydrolase [bacterium]
MKIRQIADNVYYLAGPFFIFYVIKGTEKTALIELGISQLVPQIHNDIKSGLDGVSPDVLIAPHGHFDHAGAASRWRKELPNAEICASEPAAALLSNPNNLPPYIRSMKSSSDNPFFKFVFPLAEAEPFIEPLTFDTILKDGDEIDLGNEKLEVIETPGHSACSLSFFHPGSASLFISDACGLPLPSGRIWPSAFLDKDLYKQSISRLMQYNASHVCAGHSVPMSNPDHNKRFFEKNISATDNFFQRVSELWNSTQDRDATLKALYDEYVEESVKPLSFVFKYGNREMARQVIDGVPGRG